MTGHPIGQQFRCRCGAVITLEAPSSQARLLTCPHCGAGVAPSAAACNHCNHELLLKACPRCLSRVFHGHKHCPDCGAELSIAAIAEAKEDHPCPRCEHPLGARRVGDLVVDECMKCRGLFLDHIAIKRVVTDRQQSRADALLGALPRAQLAILPPDGRMYIKCPMCHVVMNRTQFAEGAGVVVDVCKTHGTFFDIGELPRIIEFVQQGGLEKAEKKQLERLRASAKRDQQDARSAQAMATGHGGDLPRSSGQSAGGALIDLLTSLWR
ncbi:MAG: zf-TFIIB domain-containing protein [Kofleriaceae bacterium]